MTGRGATTVDMGMGTGGSLARRAALAPPEAAFVVVRLGPREPQRCAPPGSARVVGRSLDDACWSAADVRFTSKVRMGRRTARPDSPTTRRVGRAVNGPRLRPARHRERRTVPEGARG